MTRVVFDASALIALVRDEPGAAMVAGHIGSGIISAINLQEVIKTLLQRGITLDVLQEIIGAFRLEVHEHDEQDAYLAASIWPVTDPAGCGIGDRSCLALAIKEGIPVLTADRQWSQIEIPGLKVQLIR